MLQYNSNCLRNSVPFSEDNPPNILGLCADDTAIFGAAAGTAAIIIIGTAGAGLIGGGAGGGGGGNGAGGGGGGGGGGGATNGFLGTTGGKLTTLPERRVLALGLGLPRLPVIRYSILFLISFKSST